MAAHKYTDDFVTIHHGDCLEVMATFEPDSIDAIVTDPPYGLSFMGREWDHGVPGEAFWREALRVAKPGAHLVAFGGTRTHHRLMCAIEDAGWEIRDCLGWLYGSGFPKSHDVSKAIDKAAGAERTEVIGHSPYEGRRPNAWGGKNGGDNTYGDYAAQPEMPITAPATEAAAKWSGWGTALKPAWEPIILARKPLGSTVAACVQTWGTGALNVDGCRIATDEVKVADKDGGSMGYHGGGVGTPRHFGDGTSSPLGRWPANIVHDGSDEVLAVFPQTTSGFMSGGEKPSLGAGMFGGGKANADTFGDSGSAARFFYTAKASKSERDEGLYGFEMQDVHGYGAGIGEGKHPEAPARNKNTHPTVKPVALMRWLVRLVTPPDGIVLDPFAGSGTTLVAARAEGHKSIGIELEAEHCEIAQGRMSQGVLL